MFSSPAFEHLRPELVPLNRHAAELLLNPLGVDRIPALLDRDLKQHDVRYALYRFFNKLGISYFELIHRPEKRNAHLARLRAAVDLILRVEAEARLSGLPPEPIFAELAGSIASAERLCHRYLEVGAVLHTVMGSITIFPLHQRFKESMKEELKHWPRVSDTTLAEASEIHNTYQRLQSEFERIEAELSAMISRLCPLLERKAADLRAILEQIVHQHKILIAAIHSGDIDPGEGIESLETLLSECEAIAESVEDPRERHCRILGVGPEAPPEEIKRAYRRLASKCRKAFGLDPDRDAQEKFIDVKKAYEALIRIHTQEKEEHCYV